MATTLRPRSGKEYYKIDRSILVEQGRTLTTPSANYANITPVLEKSESPSPGYMSSSPFEQPQPTREHFLFPDVSEMVNGIIIVLSPPGYNDLHFLFCDFYRKLERSNIVWEESGKLEVPRNSKQNQ